MRHSESSPKRESHGSTPGTRKIPNKKSTLRVKELKRTTTKAQVLLRKKIKNIRVEINERKSKKIQKINEIKK